MMVAALALVSCTKHELDPLTGVFPEATVVEYGTLSSCTAEKDDADRRVFTLDLTDGSTPMHLTLIGNKYFLTANQYIEALDAVAQNGNFVLGKSSIGGKNIKQGYVTVAILEEMATENGCENTYSISTVVFLEDGTPYKTSWTGKIAFEKDAVLVPNFYYTDTVAQDCTLEDGSTPVTDVESHTLVLNDPDGNFAAQFKLVRSVGTKNLAGDYTVKEYAHENFTAGNGFDIGIYFGMGAGEFIIGSYFKADGGVVIINPGETISVTDMGDGVYSIDGNGFSFLTAPEGYDPSLGTVYDMTDTVAQDCTLEDGTTAVTDVESHTLVMTDSDGAFVAQIKLIRSVGTTDLSGTYTVKEYAHENLTAGNGFDMSVFGWPIVIGTYYVKDGANVIVQPGETITVTSVGENTYKFEGSTDYVFTGRLVKGQDPDPGPNPGTDPVNVELKEFLSLTDYAMYGMNMVGIELGTAGFYYQAPDYVSSWTPSYPVDGQFLKLELYAEGGTVAPGTYVCSAANGTVNPGEFNLGADNGWGGFNGTALFTVAGGAATGVAVADGTVTVSKDGDVYTVELKSSAVNAKYVGKLSSGSAHAEEVLFLNEFDCGNKKIEIYNPGDKEIDMTGWTLSKDETVWTIPASHAKVPAKGYIVYTGKSDGNNDPTFGLSGTKGFVVVLKDTEGHEIDKVDNSSAREGGIVQIPDGKSWGRKTDGAAEFVLFDTPTIGAPNGAAASVSVKIDGDMSEWANVKGTVLEPSGTEGVEGAQAIWELKGVVDAENVYVYVKRAKLGRWTQLFNGDKEAGYYYFDFDMDNNPETGANAENSHGNYESWCYLYIFGGSADAPVFRATPTGSGKGMSIQNVKCNGKISADAVEVEVAFPRADLAEITSDTISVSVWGNNDGNPLTKVTFPSK